MNSLFLCAAYLVAQPNPLDTFPKVTGPPEVSCEFRYKSDSTDFLFNLRIIEKKEIFLVIDSINKKTGEIRFSYLYHGKKEGTRWLWEERPPINGIRFPSAIARP